MKDISVTKYEDRAAGIVKKPEWKYSDLLCSDFFRCINHCQRFKSNFVWNEYNSQRFCLNGNRQRD
ncbi:MAG: hypothetical protein KJ607_04775 [Bacteroidetes bacterium]|nr:hypothetical protein [Bacteroidota bacterium]